MANMGFRGSLFLTFVESSTGHQSQGGGWGEGSEGSAQSEEAASPS